MGVLSPEHTMSVTRGEGKDDVDGTPMEWVTFQNPDPTGVSIQLWSPSEPGHWPDKVLAKKGEYVHHIAFCSDNFEKMIEDFLGLSRRLSRRTWSSVGSSTFGE